MMVIAGRGEGELSLYTDIDFRLIEIREGIDIENKLLYPGADTHPMQKEFLLQQEI